MKNSSGVARCFHLPNQDLIHFSEKMPSKKRVLCAGVYSASQMPWLAKNFVHKKSGLILLLGSLIPPLLSLFGYDWFS